MPPQTTSTTRRVYLQKQDRLPPAQLRKLVGTQFWLMNCHGALTLDSVEGIERARVREDYSTFWLDGVFGTLHHTGKNAWIRKTVRDADEGRPVRAGWHTLDLSGFVPHTNGNKRDTRRGEYGRPRCQRRVEVKNVTKTDPQRPSRTKVRTDIVACKKFKDHDGKCEPRVQEAKQYARR